MHGVKLSGTVTSVEACGDYQVHILGGENVDAYVDVHCQSVCRSPVGVAVSLMSWEAMVENGMRGKGFKIVHLYGDHLWWVYSVCLLCI